MRESTWTESLPCALTDEEVDERATKMAKSIRKYEADEDLEKARAKAAKETLADAWARSACSASRSSPARSRARSSSARSPTSFTARSSWSGRTPARSSARAP